MQQLWLQVGILLTTFENSSMGIELGHISAIFRYPIKSMAGERLDSAKIGWHGIEGDRRLAIPPRASRRAVRPLFADPPSALRLAQASPRRRRPGEHPPTPHRPPHGPGTLRAAT